MKKSRGIWDNVAGLRTVAPGTQKNYFNDSTKGFFPSRYRGKTHSFAIADAIKLQFDKRKKNGGQQSG